MTVRMMPLVCWTVLAGCLCALPPDPTASAAAALMGDALDYGRSYINTRANWNSPRFWVESRLRITDERARTSRDYYQCGSCKSENTFPPRGLFHADNYDFMPVFSDQECVIFRRRITPGDGYLQVRPTAEAWGGIVHSLRRTRVRVLRTPKEISEAMQAGHPIVGQTEIRDAETGRTAVIEYPVKTINWNRDTDAWQVDTGPVLLPDLGAPPQQWSHRLRLAFVAFNAFDWAEFIVEQPTAITEGGKQVAKTYHYMGQVQTKARNVLLAQESGAN